MQIVQPYAKMMGPFSSTGDYPEELDRTPAFSEPFDLDDGVQLLRKVELIGRVSHRSEGKATSDSWERFIEAVVLGHGDWSITEHASVTVDAVVDRGITHEWVRHRIGAYTQESTRFVNYAKKNTKTEEFVNPAAFICPPSIEECKNTERNYVYIRWVEGRVADEQEYMAHIADGIKAQEARTCFPNALASRIVATYNLRMWRHFFIMRTCAQAHPQMRQVTIPLLAEFQTKIPLLYDDIVPNEPQRAAMSKPR